MTDPIGDWLRHAMLYDINTRKRRAMSKTLKIWLNEKGEAFHDSCFEKDESRDGYTEADLNTLSIDTACESCNGQIFGEVDDDSDDDDEEQAP